MNYVSWMFLHPLYTLILFLYFIFVVIWLIALFFFFEVIVKILRFGYRNIPKKEIKYKFWLCGMIVLLMTVIVLLGVYPILFYRFF